jgi:hypothetical protein
MRQMRFVSSVAATAMKTSDLEASAEGWSCVEGEGPRNSGARGGAHEHAVYRKAWIDRRRGGRNRCFPENALATVGSRNRSAAS